MALEKLYSIDEAAIVLGGIRPRTVENWLQRGQMKRTKIGRRTMIAESELQRFIHVSNKDDASGDSQESVVQA